MIVAIPMGHGVMIRSWPAWIGSWLVHLSSSSSVVSLLGDWSADPQVILGVALTAVVYGAGLRELGRRGKLWRVVKRRHVVSFALGLIALALALLSPLDTYDTRLFSVHMIQHLVLLEVAPPLLLLGKPIPVLLVGLPRGLVRAVARAHRRASWFHHATRQLTSPLAAWPLFVGDLLLWHMPALYEATLTNVGVHLLEHICFLSTALLFWWVVIEPQPGRPRLHLGARLLHSVTAMLPMNLLGAVYTFSGVLWYPFYATQAPLQGWAPLDDQRLGGIIMWLPGSLVFMGAGSILFFMMLAADERAGIAADEAEVDAALSGDRRRAAGA